MSAPRITLDQWRALLAVVDEGSYAKAAQALNKSQSSVTYSVQQLESQLDVKAFKIEGRKATLTPTGELLYRRARYLLDEAYGLEQSAKRLSAGWEAEIRLAVEIIFPTWLLLGCLDRLTQDSPHTRIEVVETVLGYRTDALAQGLVDLAIFGAVPSGFLGEPLMRLRFVLAAHPEHPLHRLGQCIPGSIHARPAGIACAGSIDTREQEACLPQMPAGMTRTWRTTILHLASI